MSISFLTRFQMHRYAIAVSVVAGLKLNEKVEISEHAAAFTAITAPIRTVRNVISDLRAGTYITKAKELNLYYLSQPDGLCNAKSSWFVKVSDSCADLGEYRDAVGMITSSFVLPEGADDKSLVSVRLDYGAEGQVWYRHLKATSEKVMNIPCGCLLLAEREENGHWIPAPVNHNDASVVAALLLSVLQAAGGAAKFALKQAGTGGVVVAGGALLGGADLAPAAIAATAASLAVRQFAYDDIMTSLSYPEQPSGCGAVQSKLAWYVQVTNSCGISDCVGCYAQIKSIDGDVTITLYYPKSKGVEAKQVERHVPCGCLSVGTVTPSVVRFVRSSLGLFMASDSLVGSASQAADSYFANEDSWGTIISRFGESRSLSMDQRRKLNYDSAISDGDKCPEPRSWWFVRITQKCDGLEKDFWGAYGLLTFKPREEDGKVDVRLDFGNNNEEWYDAVTKASSVRRKVPCECIRIAKREAGSWSVKK